MASLKSQAMCFVASAAKESNSSIVQVTESSEQLVTKSNSVPSTSVQVLASDEALESVFLVADDVPRVEQVGMPQAGSARAEPAPEGDPLADPLGSSGRCRNLCSVKIRSQWNFKKILKKFATEAQCVEFAEEQGLLPTYKQCKIHRRPMNIEKKGQVGQFRCRKSNCRSSSVSRATGTWFENVHLPLTLIFQIMYFYCHNFTYKQVQLETAYEYKDTILSFKTIANWYRYCRDTVIAYVLKHAEELPKIGGVGKIVHFVQSKFGQRKYKKGRQVEGQWVIGMIEDSSENIRVDTCPINERLSEILVPLIQKHVVEGTTIYTDTWSEYDCISHYGYIHIKVNSSDLEHHVAKDRIHTQKIENHLQVVRRLYLKADHKENFADWLVEYRWKRNIKMQNLDPFHELIRCVKYVYSVT